MTTPFESPSSQKQLRHALHERHVQALLADAEFIRDYSNCDERDAEAARYGREAMIEHGLGKITLEERDAILDILSFAVVTYKIGPGSDDDLPLLAIDELPSNDDAPPPPDETLPGLPCDC